ncbi:DEHA2C16236p [Debaryomyces hansenii CBS767]|mgnify:CR=1 FL=1|uniref:V-type proton ATPase subunit F n=1 Tax=Debaryomyces hansenii (strain ATCC 36239 / CBS 767 / BCRC 21394 / JCM 1990 / NBRC 0083 / IGC 2968) TaxID=284592 RepID=Q6BTS6_DEBHA|nr:DEHA2C16236p [Debaryomyces hansenii CBS767]CAG86475.2 DEHA2C16236p [Debaryomyces hansenii CBS767]|eukprot:XP_458393.2 DEHA2C16236p [Debaryomyces hansenii CBS767]
MSSANEAMSKRTLLAAIADEDSVTGLLLAGVGQISNEEGKETNFLTVIPGKTSVEDVEEAFERFTTKRDDIAILLINQHIADLIRYRVDGYTNAFPAILEIPSKDHPYDPEKDSILKKVRRLFGDN